MNSKTTWWLAGLAAALFAFIFFFERHRQTDRQTKPATIFPGFTVANVTAVQVRRGNQSAVRAERTNETWVLTAPLTYPAQGVALEGFLKHLERLESQAIISAEELSARKQTAADFGFAEPAAVVTIQQGDNG